MKIRLIPFPTWAAHDELQRKLAEMNKTLASLGAIIAQHQAMTAKEFFFLKNPDVKPTTLHDPLTPEQEDIVREFNENRKLPEEIRRGFASGGHIGMRSALGRFGEAPSEQTRASDQYPSPTPGDVNIEVLIREEQRMMDREAWDQLDLDDIGKPKE